MSNRVHLKPRIKLVDGAWEAIPPKAVHVPNLVLKAEQLCAVLNMVEPEEVWCGCGRKYGAPNFEDKFYCGSQWCQP